MLRTGTLTKATGGGGIKVSELADPTCGEAARYVARLVGWYTAGGFMDECGAWHGSGYRYEWALLSVLNEVQHEHFYQGAGRPAAEAYTVCYDAIRRASLQVNPALRFGAPPEGWASSLLHHPVFDTVGALPSLEHALRGAIGDADGDARVHEVPAQLLAPLLGEQRSVVDRHVRLDVRPLGRPRSLVIRVQPRRDLLWPHRLPPDG